MSTAELRAQPRPQAPVNSQGGAAGTAGQQTPPQGGSRGENFSAKPAPALFASDCTGAGCHKGPQGLAKSSSALGLTSFLREHYTNSRESAAALAAYLMGAGPAETPRGARPGSERSPRAAARGEEAKPPEGNTPAGRPGRIVIPGPPGEPGEGPRAEPPKPAQHPGAAAGRPQRGRQATAPPPQSQPAAAPEPPPPPPPPAPPPPQVFDIFD